MVKIEKYKCIECGSYLYRTDAGGLSVTLQCSSENAKFWEFNRGTKDQHDAHNHFIKSTVIITKKEWDNETKEVQRF